MYCPRCGTKNEDDANYCKACGQSLASFAIDAHREEESRTESEIAPVNEDSASVDRTGAVNASDSSDRVAFRPGYMALALAVIVPMVLLVVMALSEASSQANRSVVSSDATQKNVLSSSSARDENSFSKSETDIISKDIQVTNEFVTFDAGDFCISVPSDWSCVGDASTGKFTFYDENSQSKLHVITSKNDGYESALVGFNENKNDSTISTTQVEQIGTATEDIVCVDYGALSCIQANVKYSGGNALFDFGSVDDVSDSEYDSIAESVLGSFSTGEKPVSNSLKIDAPAKDSLPGSSEYYRVMYGRGNGQTSGWTDVSIDSNVDVLVEAQEIVKAHLKAPKTADFPWSFDEYKMKENASASTHEGYTRYKVSGYVDAENSFGVKIRSHFTVVLDCLDTSYYEISCDID